MAIAGESHFLKTLCNQWSQLKSSNRLLVIRREEPETNTMHELAVAPLNLRRTVLRYMHDNKTSGHLGVNKTMGENHPEVLLAWDEKRRKGIHSRCEKCAKRKGPTKTKMAPIQIVRSGYPMERIALDIIGELPCTERGNKYILVITDYFTK